MDETRDSVTVRIDSVLDGLPCTFSKHSISRVDDDKRKMNQNVYDPRILSIGPFHHGKDQLCKMQQHKYMYLKLLLKRRNESTVDKYVAAVRSMEEKARNSYAEPLKFNQDEFVEILLLDGVFIIELLRRIYMFDDDENDIILQRRGIGCQLYHDLLLLENQIPFFILDHLFNMTKSQHPDDNIGLLIREFFGEAPHWSDDSGEILEFSTKDADHLLGVVYENWCSYKLVEDEEVEVADNINPTSELQKAGVVFQSDRESMFWDIRFINGVMKIPTFDVTVDTETLFLNLIAYEDLFPSGRPRYFMDYSFFWSCLINSSEDVGALRRCGIINNYLVDDEMVHQMFNRIGSYVSVSFDFSYFDVFHKVNIYYGCRWCRWMANLKRSFNTLFF